MNPYLALAAAIAGGLWGIEHELELEPAFTGNAYQAPEVPRIPSNLADAIDSLAGSEVAAEAFGARGPPAPAQYRPPGMGRGQPGGHRLGAGPQFRAHLRRRKPSRGARSSTFPPDYNERDAEIRYTTAIRGLHQPNCPDSLLDGPAARVYDSGKGE